MEDATKCVQLIVNTMKKAGVKINKTTPRKPDLKPKEVTAASYADIDIEQLLDNVEILEDRLEEELSVNVINALIYHYQKVKTNFPR